MDDPIEQLRAVVAAAPPEPPGFEEFLGKVRDRAYRITDADVAALVAAGHLRGRDLRADRRSRDRRGPAAARRRPRGDRMRLAIVDSGHAPDEAAMLDQIRERTGREPLGVVKTLLYRPELFGQPFSIGSRPRDARPVGLERGRTRALRGVHVAAQSLPVLNGLPRRSCVVRARRGGLGSGHRRLADGTAPPRACSDARLPREADPSPGRGRACGCRCGARRRRLRRSTA